VSADLLQILMAVMGQDPVAFEAIWVGVTGVAVWRMIVAGEDGCCLHPLWNGVKGLETPAPCMASPSILEPTMQELFGV
jgi:hypothetical protein